MTHCSERIRSDNQYERQIFFDLVKKLNSFDCIKKAFRIINKINDSTTKDLLNYPGCNNGEKLRYIYNISSNKLEFFDETNMNFVEHILIEADQSDENAILDRKYSMSKETKNNLSFCLKKYYFDRFNSPGRRLLTIFLEEKDMVLTNILYKIIPTLMSLNEKNEKIISAASFIQQTGNVIIDYSFHWNLIEKEFDSANFISILESLNEFHFFDYSFNLKNIKKIDRNFALIAKTVFKNIRLDYDLLYILLCKYLFTRFREILQLNYKQHPILISDKILKLFKKILFNNGLEFAANIQVKLKDYITDIMLLINNFLLQNEINMGKEVVIALEQSNYLSVETTFYDIIKKKNKPLNFIVNDNQLFLNITNKYPSLTKNSSPIKTIKLTEKSTLSFKNEENRIRQNNQSITGYFGSSANLENLNSVFADSTYKINFKFAIEILNLLLLLNTTEIKDIINNEYLLYGLSELYKLNLVALKKYDSELPGLLFLLIKKCLDFNNHDHFDLSLELLNNNNNKNVVTSYKTILIEIQNSIYSYKLQLTGWMSHLTIMSILDYFVFRYFLDTRGRKYWIGSYLNPQLGTLQRNSLRFYNEDNEDSSSDEEFVTILSLLKSQIKSISNLEFNKLISLSKTELISLTDIKIGDRFRLWLLITDFIDFSLKKKKFTFNTFFGLDATSSGLQMVSLLLKSSNLADFCGLKKNHTDIYTLHANLRKIFLGQIKSLFKYMSEEMICFLTNSFSDKKNICIKTSILNSKSIYTVFKKLPLKIRTQFLQKQLFILTQKGLTNEFNMIKQLIFTLNLSSLKRNAKQVTTFEFIYLTLQKFAFITKCLVENSSIELFLCSRNSSKTTIMTTLYGSTTFSHKKQLTDACFSFCFKNGVLINNKLLRMLQMLSPMFSKILNNWCKNDLFEFKLLHNVLSKHCTAQAWGTVFDFDLGHFNFTIKPYKQKLIRLPVKILNKQKYIGFTILNKNASLDFNSLRRGLTANLIQALDATILHKLFEKIAFHNNALSNKNNIIKIFSIHDSFHVNPLASLKLKSLLKETYMDFYKDDYFTKIFQIDYPAIYYAIKEIKMVQLTEEELSLENIVKH